MLNYLFDDYYKGHKLENEEKDARHYYKIDIDHPKIILVNRQIFVWMHEPVRLLNLTVIQYDNYDAMKTGRFTRLEYIAINAPKFNNCRQVQALPTDHFKYLTAVELNGDGKAFKQGELVWIDLFRVMRTDKIHSLTLINMGRPHTLQSVGARTMTYCYSSNGSAAQFAAILLAAFW